MIDLENARATYSAGCAEDAANLMPDLIAEIERLRAIIDKPLEEKAWKMDCDILNASPDDAEFNLARRWHAAYRKAQNSNLIRAQEIERQAARIKELEEAHKRSGAKYAKIINELRSSVYVKIPSLQKQWDDVLAEGKIGPDADECPDDLPPIGSPYRSWQITDERFRAIRWASEMAGDCKAGDVLRAMLEAGQ